MTAWEGKHLDGEWDAGDLLKSEKTLLGRKLGMLQEVCNGISDNNIAGDRFGMVLGVCKPYVRDRDR